MTKVLLVDPPGVHEGVNVGLAYLSASLISKGHEVKVLDFNNYRDAVHNRIKNALSSFQPDIVGISVSNATITQSMILLNRMKGFHPNALFSVGGSEPTINGTYFLKNNKNINLVVIGEGEHTILEICEFLEGKRRLEEIKGILFRDRGDVKSTGFRGFIEDLDSLPFPNYDFFDSVVRNLMKVDPYPIVTSRGCPYSCTFCCAHLIVGKKWRYRSPKNVVEELKQAKEKYHVKDVNIYDDNFTLDIERAKRICDLTISEDLGLRFWCRNGIRADRIDKELAEKMKEAGFYRVSIGIESGDPFVFSKIKKGETLKEIEKAVKLIKQTGMEVYGFLIIGLPYSTFESDMRSIHFARKLKLNVCVWAQFIPYPGTQAYEWVKQAGHFLSEELIDTASHFQTEQVFETPEYSKEEREFAYRLACIKTFGYGIYPKEPLYRKVPKILKFILKYDREQVHKHIIKAVPALMISMRSR